MAHRAQVAATTDPPPVLGELRAAASQAWHQAFRATPDQASAARRYLAAILNGSALADDALTCLGELVNNAIIHSNSRYPGGIFTVRIEVRPRRLRVEVHDHGGPWAPSHNGSDALNTGGQGLLIVSQLASSWGVAPRTTAPHRTGWFEMDLG